MQCPHCQSQEKDGAQDCSKCGFNFTKWNAAAKPGTQSSPPLVSPPAPIRREQSSGTWVWAVVLVAAIGVWFLNKAGSETGPAAASVGKASAPPPADDAWRFQGRVYDLLRGGPIKGVKVTFIDLETSQRFQDVTDDAGDYSVDAAIHWRLGYAAALEHPLYLGRTWPGSAAQGDRKERLKMGLAPDDGQATPTYRGSRDKKPTAIDFALFPKDLSDAEKAEAGQ